MGAPRIRAAVGLLAASALLSACGLPARATTGATVPVTLRPEPATLSLAAVQRLTDDLDHLYGETVRAIVATGVPDAAFYSRLRATFAETAFDRLQDFLGEEAAAGFPEWRRPPGDPSTKVREILDQNERCLVLATDRDLRAWWTTDRGGYGDVLLVLGRPEPGTDPQRFNATGWVIVDAAPVAQNPEVRARCLPAS